MVGHMLFSGERCHFIAFDTTGLGGRGGGLLFLSSSVALERGGVTLLAYIELTTTRIYIPRVRRWGGPALVNT